MDELTKFLVKELIDGESVTAIYGGGFKPPTKGHFDLVKTALKDFKDIDKFIIYVGSGVRDGIEQEQSLQIWDIYKELLPSKVQIEPSATPIGDIMRYAKNHPDEKVYFVIGYREGREDDLDDIKNRTKGVEEKYPNLEVRVIKTPSGDMSGTNARKALKKGDKEQFFTYLPTEVPANEKEDIYNILEPTVFKEGSCGYDIDAKTGKQLATPGGLEEADPKTGTGKKPKGSSRRLYTDEDPSDTVKVKFSTKQDIIDTFSKESFKSKPHARQSQVINLIHQRVRAAYERAKDPDVKKRLKTALNYAEQKKEASKEKTQRLKKENVAPNHDGKSAPFGSGYKQVNELRQGLLNYLKQQLPNFPDYVIRDWVYKFSKEGSAEGIQDWIDSQLKDLKWEFQKDFPISMDMFTDKTKKDLESRIKGEIRQDVDKDIERHKTQQNLLKSQGISKEPIIIFKTKNGKYELGEGWHRTTQAFKMYPEGFIQPKVYIGLNAKWLNEILKERTASGNPPRYRAIEKRGDKYYYIQDNPFASGIRQEFGPYKTKEQAKKKMGTFPPSQNYRDITENTIPSIDVLEKIAELTNYMRGKGYNIDPSPSIELVGDDMGNAEKFLGKTAYYDPINKSITLYTYGRHPKDIVRSFAHEMIHHIQNLEGRLGDVSTTNTLEDDHVNNLEKEANLKGTMTFRNWTDSIKEDGQKTSNKNMDDYKKQNNPSGKVKDPFGLNQYARELAQGLEESSIHEVGEGSAKTYDWELLQTNPGDYTYGFTTDSGIEYEVELVTLNYEDDETGEPINGLEIGFGAGEKGKDKSEIEVINRGEVFRVMATIVEIIQFAIKLAPDFKLTNAIIYNPARKKGEDSTGNQRDKLYQAYIKKAIPNITFSKEGTAIVGKFDSLKEISYLQNTGVKENDEEMREKKYVIYSDMDGVLVDFDKGYKDLTDVPTEQANAQGKNVFWKLFKDSLIKKNIPERSYWADLKPMPDKEKLWNFISPFNPYVLTAPSVDFNLPFEERYNLEKNQSMQGKTEWADKYLSNMRKLYFRSAGRKSDFAGPNKILIDDREDTIDSWNANGGIGILHTSAASTIDALNEIDPTIFKLDL
jgi:hypothetical protein